MPEKIISLSNLTEYDTLIKQQISNATQPLTGTSDPTTSTVAKYVGQLYLNTSGNSTWQCTAIFSDSYTWVQLARGSGGVASVGATSGSHIAIGGTTTNPTVGVESGYSIPSTTKQTEWDNKQNALTIDTILSGASTNPIQNKAIVNGLKDATICVFQSTGGFSISLSNLSGFTCIDWGDDSAFTTTTSHTYSSAGPFICKIYGMTSIPTNGFLNCSYLRQIYFGIGITSVGSASFKGCSNLNTATFSQSLTSIGYQGFYGCSSLKNIVVPKSVTSLGNYAFYNCTGLLTITFEGNTPPTVSYSSTFTNIGSCVLYVPYAALSSYKSAQNYPPSIIHSLLPDNSGGIDISDIKGTPTILRLELPSASSTVGFVSIVNCTYIDWGDGTVTDGTTQDHTYDTAGTKFIMIYGITDISGDQGDPWLSTGTSYLTGVTLGSTVTTLTSLSFNGCTSLKEVKLSNYLTTIGTYAFQGCTALESIKLPSSLGHMWDGAFSGCTSLSLVEFEGITPPSDLMETPSDPLFPSTATLIVPKGAAADYATAFTGYGPYTFTEYSTSGGGGGGGATWHSVNSSTATVTLSGSASVFTVCYYGISGETSDNHGTSTIIIPTDTAPLEIRGTTDGYGTYATAYQQNFDPVSMTYTEGVISISGGGTIKGYFSY